MPRSHDEVTLYLYFGSQEGIGNGALNSQEPLLLLKSKCHLGKNLPKHPPSPSFFSPFLPLLLLGILLPASLCLLMQRQGSADPWDFLYKDSCLLQKRQLPELLLCLLSLKWPLCQRGTVETVSWGARLQAVFLAVVLHCADVRCCRGGAIQ